MNQKTQILQNAVLLRLKQCALGNNRKGDKNLIGTDADKTRLHLTVSLFDCPEYRAICNFHTKVKTWVLARAIQVPLDLQGVYVLPLGLVEDVDSRLRLAQDVELPELVDKFLAVYEDEKNKAQERMADQYNPMMYPTLDYVRASFSQLWTYIQIEVPKNLPAELIEQEMAKREVMFDEMSIEIRKALRVSFLELVKHLTEKLTLNDDGKKRGFRDSQIENLVEFMDLFAKRDITDDAELRGLVSEAREIVNSATPDQIRKSKDFSEAVRKDMAEVKAQVSKLIETMPSTRRFNFDD